MNALWKNLVSLPLLCLAVHAVQAEPAPDASPPRTDGGAQARRLVALGPWITDIVFALGLEDAVVAVDAASVYPPQAADKARLPYYRNLNAEGVLAQRPDLVLAAADAGPSHALAQLQAAGVRFASFPQPHTLTEAWTVIAALGETVGRGPEAKQLVEHLQARVAALQQQAKNFAAHPRVLVVFAPASGTVLAAGRASAADELLQLVGAENGASEMSGLKPLSAEAIVHSNADWIVTTEHTLRALGGAEALWQLPGIERTAAGRARRLFVAPDVGVLSIGPTFVRSAEQLFHAFQERAHIAREGDHGVH